MPTEEQIQDWLVQQIAEIVYLDTEEIDVTAPFSSFGLSSKDAVILSGDLEDWLDRRLSPTIVYEYPTIENLAIFLSGDGAAESSGSIEQASSGSARLRDKEGIYKQTATNTEGSLNLETAVSDIEKLTDEEAEALLLEKLQQLDD